VITILRGNLTQKREEDGSVVLGTALPGKSGCKQAREQKIRRKDRGRGVQFTATEKNGKGMALKSLTGAKPFLKARMSLVDRGNRDAYIDCRQVDIRGWR